MFPSRIDSLYRQIILDHSRNPHNYGKLSKISHQAKLFNPSCGDVIHLELEIREDLIQNISFSGSACSICIASASMMTDIVLRKTIPEALDLSKKFLDIVKGSKVEDTNKLKDAIFLRSISKFPTRIKCATLAWKSLEKAINQSENLF